MASKTSRFLAELKGNMDAWYGGRIDYATFGERQRATWDAIHGAGMSERVLRALREQLPSAARAF